MKILALDIATTSGYSSSTGESGTFNCSFKKGESGSIRLLRFRNKVNELLDLIKPEVVAYERSAGRNTHSIKTQSEMIGVLTLMLEDRNIQYASYSPSEVKKFFTGKGNASKEDMIKTAKKKYTEIEILDDNHADALAILELAQSDLL
ncbi:crossover junction endodeoxyribonuclease RuvC [Elizabethkingia anophelis]|uniref:crossover junction endodeoxyribonuclease RuvC n=1 Tax=Elizabethkingia anophelis TaxID=1117645 RepID=UPI002405CE58|nr:crossover junction endodeoxyribonuclease RuvC [Elizabethkingia anophelis]